MKTKFAISYRNLILRGIFILSFGMAFSQDDYRRTVNAKIIDVITGDTLSSHSSDIEAVQQLRNLKSKGLEVKMLGAVYDVDISERKVIDTIEAIRVMQFNGWVDRAEISSLENTAYLPFYGHGVIDFKTDTVYNWQIKYKFKRVKSFGKVSYKNLGVPFQFTEIWFDEITDIGTVIHVKITEPYIHINSWIDGVQFKEFNRPNADGNNPFLFGISPLVKGQQYDFRMEVTNQKGEVIIYQTILKL